MIDSTSGVNAPNPPQQTGTHKLVKTACTALGVITAGQLLGDVAQFSYSVKKNGLEGTKKKLGEIFKDFESIEKFFMYDKTHLKYEAAGVVVTGAAALLYHWMKKSKTNDMDNIQ